MREPMLQGQNKFSNSAQQAEYCTMSAAFPQGALIYNLV